MDFNVLRFISLFGTVEVVLILNSNYSKNANTKISFSTTHPPYGLQPHLTSLSINITPDHHSRIAGSKVLKVSSFQDSHLTCNMDATFMTNATKNKYETMAYLTHLKTTTWTTTWTIFDLEAREKQIANWTSHFDNGWWRA